MRRQLLTLLISIALLLGEASFAKAQDKEPNYTTDLGIALESYPYPYPVQYLSVGIQGQLIRMAYMYVAPSAAPNGRTVLLLHGKNFYGFYWENTIRALREAGYRVVVPDQIGFGKSSKPDISYSFDLLAANTLKLLDSLGIRQVAVVGHSTGGMLAVRFARTYPARVTHLILEDPVGLEDYRLKIPPQTIETLYTNELENTDPEKIRAFFKRYFVTWKPEQYERFVEIAARIALSGEFPRFAKASALTYQMIYQQPVRYEFSLIQTPTLLIIGREDRTVVMRNYANPEVLKTMGDYPKLGREAAHDIPNSKLVELENVGHVPHLEAPERFHNELLSFLAR